MSKINYKCESCGNLFSGDEYTLECPVCGGSSLTNAKSEKGGKKKIFYIIGGVILLVLLIISLKQCGGKKEISTTDDSVSESSISLYLKKKPDFIQIIIKKKIVKEGKRSKIKTLSYSDAEPDIKSLKFKAIQNNEKVSIVEDKIYPCDEGDVLISWNKYIELDNFSNGKNSKIVKFKFDDGIAANKLANCKPPLELMVVEHDSCMIEVKTNYDSLFPDEKVYISINGLEGPFIPKRKWSCKEGKKVLFEKFDVWGYVGEGKDTVAAINNNDIYSALGCIKIDPTVVIKAVNNYASNPANRKYLSAFKRKVKGHVRYYVDGTFIKGGIHELENKLRIEKIDNNNTYKASIKFTKDNKYVTSIKFTKK